MSRRSRAVLGAAIALVLLLVVVVAAVQRGDEEVETIASIDPTTSGTQRPRSTTTTTDATTTTTAEETTTTTAETLPVIVAPVTAAPQPRAAPPTTAAPVWSPPETWPPETRPPPPPPPAPTPAPIASGGVEPYRGLGVWLDVLDWSPSYTGGRQPVAPSAVTRMADLGVQTIYIQTSRFNRPEDIIDPTVLGQFIDNAHARGIRVVAWYMPTHEDQETDVRRLIAAANLPVEGVCVNIESTNQGDIALRNARVLDLSQRLRAATGKSMSAVVVPPVVTQILNKNYWPNFPWQQLNGLYDVWMPMAYWSNRTPDSGWRDGYRYIAENTNLIRALTGNPGAVVHPVGGIGNEITAAEVDGMARALHDTGAIGGSIYDYATTGDELWASLAAFRR